MSRFVTRWLPVVLWMGLIFIGSTDALSSEHTSRLLVPLLRWLVPGISAAALDQVQLMARKSGHVTEYAVLAVLLWRMFPQPDAAPWPKWHWPHAGMALLIASLYALSDEVHQSFYPSRYASALDVLVDTAGAAVGLGLAWLVSCWRRRR